MLTAEQLAKRGEFGASDAPTLMSGDTEKLLDMWRVKCGLIPPHDFTNDWRVQLGSHLEQFILDWHEKQTGHKLIERGIVMRHPAMKFLTCTLDAYRPHDDCVLDAKVINAWYALDDAVRFYTPQILVQMRCRQCQRGALLIVHGNAEPLEIEIGYDDAYETELFQRIAAFQLCVETLTPPAPVPQIVPPDKWRSIDLMREPKPNYADDMKALLLRWEDTKDIHDLHAATAADIKALMPDDAGLVQFGSLSVTRNRRGALTIKREAA